MNRIEEARKTFRILFIKTTPTIPYTSAYMRLDCGYRNDEVGLQDRDCDGGRRSTADKIALSLMLDLGSSVCGSNYSTSRRTQGIE
jgi:hypothetical protein